MDVHRAAAAAAAAAAADVAAPGPHALMIAEARGRRRRRRQVLGLEACVLFFYEEKDRNVVDPSMIGRRCINGCCC